MQKKYFVILLFAVCGGFSFVNAAAQQAAGGRIQLGEEQRLMLDAAGKVMKRDYKGAEDIYSQVISADKGNIDAYLQRGVIRRQMGDETGTASDGRTTVTLANATLAANPNDPNLYYKRGMGFRLLKNYDQATKDIQTGIRLGGPASWQTDLQAIAFERKEQNSH